VEATYILDVLCSIFMVGISARAITFRRLQPSAFRVFTQEMVLGGSGGSSHKKLRSVANLFSMHSKNRDCSLVHAVILHQKFLKTGKVHTTCRSFFISRKYRNYRNLQQFYIVQCRPTRELPEGGFLRPGQAFLRISLYPVVKRPHP